MNEAADHIKREFGDGQIASSEGTGPRVCCSTHEQYLRRHYPDQWAEQYGKGDKLVKLSEVVKTLRAAPEVVTEEGRFDFSEAYARYAERALGDAT